MKELNVNQELEEIKKACIRLEAIQKEYNISELMVYPIWDCLQQYKHRIRIEQYRNSHS